MLVESYGLNDLFFFTTHSYIISVFRNCMLKAFLMIKADDHDDLDDLNDHGLSSCRVKDFKWTLLVISLLNTYCFLKKKENEVAMLKIRSLESQETKRGEGD